MLAQQNVYDSKRAVLHPADLLVGVCALDEGHVFGLLKDKGLDKRWLESRFQAVLGIGDSTPYPELPFTDAAKRCLELCWDEARNLNSEPISEGHILLGLLKADDKVIDEALQDLYINKQELQVAIRSHCNSLTG